MCLCASLGLWGSMARAAVLDLRLSLNCKTLRSGSTLGELNDVRR